MEAWVTHAPNHQTGRISPLSLRFDVAMRGALGIGASLNELDETELAEYASYIAFFTRRYRPGGWLQPDVVCETDLSERNEE